MLAGTLEALSDLRSISDVTELEDRVEFTFAAADLDCANCDFKALMDEGILVLTIDGDRAEEWQDIAAAPYGSCNVNLFKNEFIDSQLNRLPNSTNLLFFSIDFFKEWLQDLPSPFDANHPFYRSDKVSVWLNGVDEAYVGEHLSILPVQENLNVEELNAYEADLPPDESIRAQVHVLADYSVKIQPSCFRLPDSAFGQECLSYVFACYQELLVSCLVKEFYSRDKVVVAGIKRITIALSGEGAVEGIESLHRLEKCVRWVYAERTETRLLLLMDRLSLDLPEDNGLLPSLYPHLEQALEQAQWRYEFVIKDRKEAHAKELAELQKDVKSASDGYSESAHDLVSGLLKDALSSIFLLSIGLLSRLAGRDSFLESELFAALAKGLAAYLVISVVIRVAVGYQGLRLSWNDLLYWKNVTRNHMSADEFNEHVEARTDPYKRLYRFSVMGVFVVHLVLACFAWNLPAVLANNSSSVDSVSSEKVGKQANTVPFKLVDKGLVEDTKAASTAEPSIEAPIKVAAPASDR
ncbi:hypothetical protein [Neptuniibacter marinus]|uniref:hypothetical protein n=1 Tax=Neptuniibacter marinus TaxID=1806670 RepID=UPI000834A9B7|nr:hypothetical protein [Neptuniibacter marinus]